MHTHENYTYSYCNDSERFGCMDMQVTIYLRSERPVLTTKYWVRSCVYNWVPLHPRHYFISSYFFQYMSLLRYSKCVKNSNFFFKACRSTAMSFKREEANLVLQVRYYIERMKNSKITCVLLYHR